jgi:hypothetical protein
MTDALLQQILDCLGNMEGALHRLNDRQQRLETEIKNLYNVAAENIRRVAVNQPNLAAN